MSSRKMSYTVVERGSPYTSDYRVYICKCISISITHVLELCLINLNKFTFFWLDDKNGPVSPLHDIPLVVDAQKKTFNMVVEVPRWTNAKMEVRSTKYANNVEIHVSHFLDYNERDSKSDQTGREEGKATIRRELFSPSRIHLELRCPSANLGESRALRWWHRL